MDHVTPTRINDLFNERAWELVLSTIAHLCQVCPLCERGYSQWISRRLSLGLPAGLDEPTQRVLELGPFDPPEDEPAHPRPADDHLTPELLDRYHDSGALGAVFLRNLTHLLEHCPTCEAGYLTWQQQFRTATFSPSPASYEDAIERAADTTRRAGFQLAGERATARERFDELVALPPRRRLDAVRADRERYSGPALAERLIDESRSSMPGRPRESFDLACLATAVLRRSEPSQQAVDLYVLATARIANAVRVRGHLAEAAELFGAARFLLESTGSPDPLLAAELDDLEGSLLRDQRHFEEAETTLRRAATAYRAAERFVETARVLMKLDGVYFEQGDLPGALQVARQALALLDPDEEPRLHFYARHNLIDDLCESGRHAEAEELLTDSLALVERSYDPLTQLRILWLEAKIARGLGRSEEADSSLRTAQYGFLRHEMAYDAALVSLELAALYLEQGRTAEVRELAVEMVAVFEEKQIHREATAALILFRDAAELERVNLALVSDLAVYLRRARRDPSYAFQDAS